MGGRIRSQTFGSLFLLLVLAIVSLNLPTSDARDTVRLGVIFPFSEEFKFGAGRTRAAIEIALDIINNKSRIVNHTLRVQFEDSKCSDVYGPLAGVDMYMKKQVDAFLGPVCTWAVRPLEYYTSQWNILTITPGAQTYDFDNKTEYDLLTRIGNVDYKVGEFFLEIFKKFDWYTYVTIANQTHTLTEETFDQSNSDCNMLSFNIHQHLLPRYMKKYDVEDSLEDEEFYERRMFIDESVPRNKRRYDLIFEAAIRISRVIIICASDDAVRDFLLMAGNRSDIQDFVFFNIDLHGRKERLEKPWYRVGNNESAESNERARRVYEALLTVTLRRPDTSSYHEFVQHLRQLEPGNRTYPDNDEEVNMYAGFFHDAILLYASAINDTLKLGLPEDDGKAITKMMRNRSFEGVTGTVIIDEHGDRHLDYSLLDLNPEQDKFEVVANYNSQQKKYEEVAGQRIYFACNKTKPDCNKTVTPSDRPRCGLDGTRCYTDVVDMSDKPEEALAGAAAMLCVTLLVGILVYRHSSRKAKMTDTRWKVRWEDITLSKSDYLTEKQTRRASHNSWMMGMVRRLTKARSSIKSNLKYSRISFRSVNLPSTPKRLSLQSSLYDGEEPKEQLSIRTGYYKGAWVAIKMIDVEFIILTKSLLKELKTMIKMHNDHIVRFVGLCTDSPYQCILTECCRKGSLQDVLRDSNIKLDSLFKYSLMHDIVHGMMYLHNSELRSHGNLKSTNCVLDSRFVLKLTDFGLHSLRAKPPEREKKNPEKYFTDKLWTAPELLRAHHPPRNGTQKGDVYSFAIICQEIVYRQGVFYLDALVMGSEEIYQQVTKGEPPYLRPTLEVSERHADEVELSDGLANLIRLCWSENPKVRPHFAAIKHTLHVINKYAIRGTILDNILARMEQYANTLERLVGERTDDYQRQKKRAEDLLYTMLPKPVAIQLMQGLPVTSEKYDAITILFMDICGFTPLSAKSTPMQIVNLLNELYTSFDRLVGKHDCYKVETIGDAYMVVSGLPIRNGNKHAKEIATLSLLVLDTICNFVIPHRPEEQFKMRIGLHSGPCVTGVVGLKTPKFCLFGDTIIAAAGMESNGIPLKIHVSPCTKKLLDEFGTFVLELRGPMTIAGKKMITYWLIKEIKQEAVSMDVVSLTSV